MNKKEPIQRAHLDTTLLRKNEPLSLALSPLGGERELANSKRAASRSASLHTLGDLQLRILQLLWRQGEMTASRMHATLQPERGLAPTTVATMLAKMEARGLLTHREEGRAFVYRAAVDAEAVTRGLGDHFVTRLFDGSVSGAVMNLLRTREVSREELDELEKMIREAKRRAK